MSYIILSVVVVVGVLIVHGIIKYGKDKARGRYINQFQFPKTLSNKLLEKYPHLKPEQAQLAIIGLRDYFQICSTAGNKMVSMPSQAVDVVWHEFILFTRQYQTFCDKALGRFLHHTPAEAMRHPSIAQQGIKLAWKLACLREGVSPNSPTRLPRLFAMDATLAIPGGFVYKLNCIGKNDKSGDSVYCASHIGCSSGCGSSGCSGGGDGCGGGGCGGGGD